MIADDHSIFRDGLCKLLAREDDFEIVAEAANGLEALAALQQHEADVLLLDLRMPGLDGLGVLQRLQASRNKTRVIVLTAADDKNQFVQAMKLGASGIVLKQSAAELLLQCIRKVRAGEIWLDSKATDSVIRTFVAADDAPSRTALPSECQRDRERSPLTQREREIVALVAQGFRNKEMAEKLFISEEALKSHLHSIFDKLGVSDRLELARFGALPPDTRLGPRPYRSPRGLPVPPDKPPLNLASMLTADELTVCRYLIEGVLPDEIAKRMQIPVVAVYTHRFSIMRKLNIRSFEPEPPDLA